MQSAAAERGVREYKLGLADTEPCMAGYTDLHKATWHEQSSIYTENILIAMQVAWSDHARPLCGTP